MPDLISRVYKPDPSKCCEACCFGARKHADWCRERWVTTQWLEETSIPYEVLSVDPRLNAYLIRLAQ